MVFGGGAVADVLRSDGLSLVVVLIVLVLVICALAVFCNLVFVFVLFSC